MSDELVMSSADHAAAASATEAIMAVIEHRFECVDGPPQAYAEYTIASDGSAPEPGKRWETVRLHYVGISFGRLDVGNGYMSSGLGSRSLHMVVSAFPDFIEEALVVHKEADEENQKIRREDGLPILVLEPGQERLVWRRKPSVELWNGRWYCSCRLGFMPKAGVLLPAAE